MKATNKKPYSALGRAKDGSLEIQHFATAAEAAEVASAHRDFARLEAKIDALSNENKAMRIEQRDLYKTVINLVSGRPTLAEEAKKAGVVPSTIKRRRDRERLRLMVEGRFGL